MGCACRACNGADADFDEATHNAVGQVYAKAKCAPGSASWSPEEIGDPLFAPFGCEPPKPKPRRVAAAPFLARRENVVPPRREHWPTSPAMDAQYREIADA